MHWIHTSKGRTSSSSFVDISMWRSALTRSALNLWRLISLCMKRIQAMSTWPIWKSTTKKRNHNRNITQKKSFSKVLSSPRSRIYRQKTCLLITILAQFLNPHKASEVLPKTTRATSQVNLSITLIPT